MSPYDGPMRRTLLRVAPVLHLSRVTGAVAALGNVWFVILWTRAHEQEPGTAALRGLPLWVLLAGGVLVSLGLYAFGAALNDILDLRRDRLLRRERPLASGRISMDGALTLVVGTLLAAVLGSTAFGIGAVLMTLLTAAAIMLFNSAGKFVPAVGLVVLGLIYAGHMVAPNVQLRFLWPVWLVMTHALVVAGLTHVMARKVPVLSRRAAVAVVVGWAFWSGVLLVLAWRRVGEGGGPWPSWVPPGAALWPAVLAGAFVLLVARRVRQYGPGPRAAEKIGRYGALWPVLYGCGWMLGVGEAAEGLALLGVAAAGYACMTLLRELYGLMEHPVGYRR